MTDASPPALDPRLLEILVCPATHGPLVYDREAQELISAQAKLAYPIRDGVPIMLPEEARSLEPDGSTPLRVEAQSGSALHDSDEG
jgi:uncharacterized protein YbaR (Trm112 family)